MSANTVEQVIRKAVTDTGFRELLFANAEEALKDFELTEKERALFEDLDEEGLGVALEEADAGDLEERISRAKAWFN